MTRRLPRVHAVTNDEVIGLPDFQERVARIGAVAGTATHLRSGSLDGRRLTELAEIMLASCVAGEVFLNDRADIAKIVGAGGLHLPSAGLPFAAARSITGPDCWIGRSAHTPQDVARAAEEGADYVFLGPIWPTASHPGRAPLGPEILSADYDVPVIAIGGVTSEKVSECIARGAYGVAVISALWYVEDATSAVRELSLSFPL